MLSIGWVIFWKSVVVGVGAALLEIWASRVRKERENLDFKPDPKTGVYKAFSPLGAIDDFVRRWLWTGVAFLTAASFAVTYFTLFA